jgi:MoaA/NifB/PqqE/SkfB family radical SAM enzyme
MALGHNPLGNLSQNNLKEIWNGKAISELRLKMQKGERVEQCSRCYETEDTGAQSHRQWVNRDFQSYATRIDQADDQGHLPDGPHLLPIFLEIRFSNGCNFSCRTCGPEYSSSWFSDAKFLTKKSYALHRLEAVAPDFKLQIESFLPHLKKIYFAGGEPLQSNDHFAFLQHLIEKKTKLKLNFFMIPISLCLLDKSKS